MNGYMLAHGYCIACGRPITYNPNHVPSLRIDGVRHAICRHCHREWNRFHRVEKGLPEVPLHPLAYEPEEV